MSLMWYKPRYGQSAMNGTWQDRHRYIITAYLRQLFHDKDSTPMDIIDIISKFLYLININVWCTKYIDDDKSYELSHEGTRIRTYYRPNGIHQLSRTIYSESTVPIGTKHKWKIKLRKLGFSPEIYIGIIKDDPLLLAKYSTSSEWYKDGYRFDGRLRKMRYGECWDYYGQRFLEEGNIMEIELDLINFILSFNINDEDYGSIQTIIAEYNYRLAVNVECNTEIELH